MPEVHDFVERELQRAAVRPISLEAVYRRRDRRQRNRRVGAGLVGVAVAIAVVLAATRAHLLADRVPAEPTPTPPPTAEWHYGDRALHEGMLGPRRDLQVVPTERHGRAEVGHDPPRQPTSA